MKNLELLGSLSLLVSASVCSPALAQDREEEIAGAPESSADDAIGFKIETIDPDLHLQLDFAESESLDAQSKLNVVPVPVLNPTLKAGGGLAALYTFGSGNRRSTIFAGGGATGNGSWMAGAGTNLWLGHDNIKLTAMGGYGSLKQKFFGVGQDSIFEDNPVDFSGDGWMVQVNPEIEIVDKFYVGVLGRYLDAKIVTDIPIEVIPAISVPFEVMTGGPAVEYISTDHPNWPTAGTHVEAQVLYNRERRKIFNLGVGTDFLSFDLSASTYFGLRDDLVLALNGRVAGSENKAPFFLKPSVSLRGYASGQVLDNYVIEGQTELRWMFRPKFGAVAFLGFSGSSGDFESFNAATVAYGAGLRYQFSEIDRSNLGFDFAMAGDNFSVYFTLGEAF